MAFPCRVPFIVVTHLEKDVYAKIGNRLVNSVARPRCAGNGFDEKWWRLLLVLDARRIKGNGRRESHCVRASNDDCVMRLPLVQWLPAQPKGMDTIIVVCKTITWYQKKAQRR